MSNVPRLTKALGILLFASLCYIYGAFCCIYMSDCFGARLCGTWDASGTAQVSAQLGFSSESCGLPVPSSSVSELYQWLLILFSLCVTGRCKQRSCLPAWPTHNNRLACWVLQQVPACVKDGPCWSSESGKEHATSQTFLTLNELIALGFPLCKDTAAWAHYVQLLC